MKHHSGKPNIILIMADDMGYGDVGAYNPTSRIPTPHIDRLAGEGVRLTDAHAPSAVCTPTRYGVLTGRYCWRTPLKQGVIGGYARPLIEPTRLTVASMLKERGYHTACIGKWHVGLTFHDRHGQPTEVEEEVDFSQPVIGGPCALGFDYAFINAGCGTCAPPYGFIENDRFVDNRFTMFDCDEGGPVGVGRFGQWRGMMGESWVTKDADPIIADKACACIEERANREEPFFVYLTPNAPHEPCVEQFVPAFARGKSQAGARGDLVWLFDWVVGRVMETLERTGQAEHTLVMVTSDNGALPGDFALDEQGLRIMTDPQNKEYGYHCYGHRSNGDWRGYKSHIWEGGHRVPFVARWPGRIAAGSVADEPLCLTDIMATCAGLVGYELLEDAGEDSSNAAAVWLGEGDAPQRPAIVHHSSFGVFAVTRGRWKMVLDCDNSGGWPTPRGRGPTPGAPGQLYDLATDPAELHNRWHERQDIVGPLRVLIEQYQAAGRSVR